MSSKNKIEINLKPLSIQAKNSIEAKTNYKYSLYSAITYIVTLTIIFLIFYGYTNDFDFFVQMRTYNSIVNNINNFGTLVKQITDQQIAINKQRFFNSYDLFSQYQCYDMGSYYVAALLGNTYLPQFIRRGSGDIWRVTKATTVDIGAQQFCLYLINEYNDNIIECGLDYFNKVGVSGYLEGQLSDCNIITDKMYLQIP